jgi:glycosyltransferase involved in cell wall biosynthesis
MERKKLSIILPSLRREMLPRCLQTIVSNTRALDYEIIVVSPFSVIEGCRCEIKWVEDSKIAGVIYAVNRGFEAAEGEFVAALSDECRVQPDCFDNAVMFAADQADNTEVALHLIQKVIPPTRFEYYRRIFAPFPLLRKSLIEKLGCFFDENYKCFYADPDLSLRVYEIGGNVQVCPTAYLSCPSLDDAVHLNNVRKYLEPDREFFKNRWNHLGEFRDP